MSHYTVYDETGEILRSGRCSDHLTELQAEVGEFVLVGRADDVTQKVIWDGMAHGKPINPRIVNKDPGELPPEPEPTPPDEKVKHIKKKDWDALLERVEALENA